MGVRGQADIPVVCDRLPESPFDVEVVSGAEVAIFLPAVGFVASEGGQMPRLVFVEVSKMVLIIESLQKRLSGFSLL